MVFRAANIDEAIAIANDTPFGLGSSVWTKEKEEQDRFVRDIQAGMTAINQMLASSPEAPFGGIKRSGHGRELGLYGLHEFMNLKTIMHRSEEHTSELQSLMRISYAVFCLKQKTHTDTDIVI